jgi:ketosteroid isomerase-like protein
VVFYAEGHPRVQVLGSLADMRNEGTDVRVVILGFLLAGLGTVQSVAQTSHDPDIESKIIALENVAKVQAYKAKDTNTLYAILDDAFVEVDQEGRPRTKAGLLAYVQNTDSLQYGLKAMVVRLHGDTAIVTGLYTVKGVAGGKPFLQRGRFVDTWLQKNGRWVAIASLSTPNE